MYHISKSSLRATMSTDPLDEEPAQYSQDEYETESSSEEEEKTFRFNCKNLFLTYSKCPLPPSSIQDEWIPLWNTAHKLNIVNWYVVQETHADGDLHLHAVLGFAKKVHRRAANCRMFDILCGGECYHPNIRPAGYPKKLIRDYLQKEAGADYVAGGTFQPTPDYLQLAQTGDASGAITAFSQQHRMQYVLNMSKVESNLRTLAARSSGLHAPRFSLQEFKDSSVKKSVEDWLATTVLSNWFTTLVVWGDAGTGKTCLLRAVLPQAAVINHIEELDRCAYPERGIIFDDVDWSGFTPVQLRSVCEREYECALGGRYANRHIPRLTPVVIICNNPAPFMYCPNPREQEAIRRRCTFVEVTGPLFEE